MLYEKGRNLELLYATGLLLGLFVTAANLAVRIKRVCPQELLGTGSSTRRMLSKCCFLLGLDLCLRTLHSSPILSVENSGVIFQKGSARHGLPCSGAWVTKSGPEQVSALLLHETLRAFSPGESGGLG